MARNNQWKDKGGGGRNNPPNQDYNKPFVAKWKDNDNEQTLSFDKDWIVTNIEMETVRYADRFGKYLVDQKLTTSQLRNFFGEVRRIQMNFKPTDLYLLKPKLAYASKKAKGYGVKALKLVLDEAHEAVVESKDVKIMEERFDRFVSFMEAILAYHKGYGGEDTGR